MDITVALSHYVDTLSGEIDAFAKVSTEVLFQFPSPVPLTFLAHNMAWNCVEFIGLQTGTLCVLQAAMNELR